MIDYACRCGTRLIAADDEAGAEVQCPGCGLLVTVPALSELAGIQEDGTYRVGLAPEPPPDSARDLHRAFSKDKFDLDGVEIDLRYTAVTPASSRNRLGPDESAPLPRASAQLPDYNARPRYDPETGELVKQLPVEPAVIPPPTRYFAPKPKRDRIVVDPLDRVRPMEVLVKLFEPANVAVMLIFALAHVLLLAMVLQVSLGLLLIAFILLAVPIALFGHFANVIDETGPTARDELPRPLRDVSWNEDIWSPFLAVAVSTAACFVPAAISLWTIGNAGAAWGTFAVLAAIGTILAPATLLTAATSGSIANLRPDRVLGVVTAMKRVYPVLLVGFVGGVVPYAVGLVLLSMMAASLGTIGRSATKWLPQVPISGGAWVVAAGLLFGGIFLSHWFCWCLGRAYRVYHRRFPWVNQGSFRPNDPEPGAFPVLAPRVSTPSSAKIPVARRADAAVK